VISLVGRLSYTTVLCYPQLPRPYASYGRAEARWQDWSLYMYHHVPV